VVNHLDVANRLRHVLLKLNRELRRELRDFGVTGGQASLLYAIQISPGIGVRELADREGISAAGMSGHVDRLERAGFVKRTGSTTDRRRVGLEVTDEAKRVLDAVKRRRTTWLAKRLAGLSKQELEAIDRAIEPLAELLATEEEQALVA
jgi:DNA-binding MarR family transcriptional regulator